MNVELDLSPDFQKAIECLGRTHEAADTFTANHGLCVGVLTETLAKHMGVSAPGATTLNYAARLHDIGKIIVPQEILHAPRVLTEAERRAMEGHSMAGSSILRPNDTPFFDLAADIAATHHEYEDGSGYPLGLQNGQIPLASKVVTLCDVYEALRSPRSYKGGLSHAAVVSILTKGDDRVTPSMFDPRVLKAFVNAEAAMNQIFEAHKDAN